MNRFWTATCPHLCKNGARELVGLCLLVLAFLFAVMLGSYTPDDPGWMAASDEPVRNSLGRVGATLAAPLMVILGWASWSLVLFTAVWGLRLVLARGHEALMARSVFLPIAMAVAAVWCATLVPGESWQPVTGLGGVFGDTVLGAVVNALPMSAGAGVRFMSMIMLGATLIILGYVLGVSLREMRRFTTFFRVGHCAALCWARCAIALGGLGQGVKSAQRASGAMLDHARQKAHARAMQREAAMEQPANAH